MRRILINKVNTPSFLKMHLYKTSITDVGTWNINTDYDSQQPWPLRWILLNFRHHLQLRIFLLLQFIYILST
jgi:hypothetical protein